MDITDRIKLLPGDCMDVLATLADNSLDSCVTDPPYHLVSIVKRFGADNAAPARDNGFREKQRPGSPNTGPYVRASSGFMGKQWDGGAIAQSVDLWRQVYRVLKPGAHLVAFGGDRTQHRMACAIEDAGFEIRGTIAWIFGSGFPKSLNVSKRMRESFSADVLCSCGPLDSQIAQDFSSDYSSCSRPDDEQLQSREDSGQAAFPLTDGAHAHIRVDQLADDLAEEQANIFPDVETARLSSADSAFHSSHRLEGYPDRDNIPSGKLSSKLPDELTAARRTASDKSDIPHSGDGLARYANLPRCPQCGKYKIADGLGSALKPAMEVICMARKPLSEKTVAANVLRWGAGAINIDACRVGNGDDRTNGGNQGSMPQPMDWGTETRRERPIGARWPANVIHDGSDEVLAGFPDNVGANGGKDSFAQHAWMGGQTPQDIDRDKGSSARFFYTAKADSDDRIGSKHPTVKPLDLMQYLVRLVTPKGGTVIDPFAGSGTTGEAAFREGMKAVLIERESEYQADIRRRMALCLAGPDERMRQSMKAKMEGKPRDDGPLFGGTDWDSMWQKPFDKPELL